MHFGKVIWQAEASCVIPSRLLLSFPFFIFSFPPTLVCVW